MTNKTTKKLPNGIEIFVFQVEYLLATKFEALINRGGRDIRGGHDWEDIVYVITNSPELFQRIKHCKNEVLTKYFKEQFSLLLKNDNIREIIYSALPYNSPDHSIDEVLDFMNKIII